MRFPKRPREKSKEIFYNAKNAGKESAMQKKRITIFSGHYGSGKTNIAVNYALHLAHEGKTVSELRKTYPEYFIAKNRIDLDANTDVDAILAKVKEMFKDEQVNDIDGVKIDFPDKWVHLRKSNTEPIIRVYSEAATMAEADEIGKKIMDVVYEMAK
jgi:phosphomannomutase